MDGMCGPVLPRDRGLQGDGLEPRQLLGHARIVKWAWRAGSGGSAPTARAARLLAGICGRIDGAVALDHDQQAGVLLGFVRIMPLDSAEFRHVVMDGNKQDRESVV